MDRNYGYTAQSVKMSSQAPLDAKLMVNRLSDLTYLGENNIKAFEYYRGMIVYCHENRKRYEWTDALNNKTENLLPENFKYPNGSTYDSIDYSELEFNFILVKPNQQITIENSGAGIPLFNGINEINDNIKLASLKSDSNELEISKKSDDSIHFKLNIDYKPVSANSIGTGTPVLVAIRNNVIDVATIKSSDESIKIEQEPDKSINLKAKAVNLKSPDQTIRIDKENIESNVSKFQEEIKGQSKIKLAFTPTNLIGIYVNGKKLFKDDFLISLPNSIELIPVIQSEDLVSIEYEHVIS